MVLITVIYINFLLMIEIIIKNLKAYNINTYKLWGIEFTYYFKNTLESLQISIWPWVKTWKMRGLFCFFYRVSSSIKQPQFRWYIVKIIFLKRYYFWNSLCFIVLERLVTVKMRARSSLLLIFICLMGKHHSVLWLHDGGCPRMTVLLHD